MPLFLVLAMAAQVTASQPPSQQFGSWTLTVKHDDFDETAHCSLTLAAPAGKLAAVAGHITTPKLGVAGFRDTSSAEYKIDDAAPVSWAMKAIIENPSDGITMAMTRAGIVLIDLLDLRGHSQLKIRRSPGEDTVNLDIHGLNDALAAADRQGCHDFIDPLSP